MLGFEAVKTKLMSQDEISELISAAKSDPTAFGRLYDRYLQPVYRYLYSRLGDAHSAEDVTSQTFITAYEALPKYREQGQFTAWLFRIARSKMYDYLRKNKREVELEAAGELLEREDALGTLIRAEELSKVRFLIKQLNEEEQDLIRLRYVADLTFVEIADLLGKREDAVKKTLYRLLARLKGQME
ncbi:MAG TPA: sigma-70 family RNA polymerase sigma factor [Anaerolineales bacterium]|nr:sigma-70 family RNA polymerase sigma factor [Anaerolineales bacterium]